LLPKPSQAILGSWFCLTLSLWWRMSLQWLVSRPSYRSSTASKKRGPHSAKFSMVDYVTPEEESLILLMSLPRRLMECALLHYPFEAL